MDNSNFDIHLLQANLDLTPEERLIQHQYALDLLWEIDKAKLLLDEKSQ